MLDFYPHIPGELPYLFAYPKTYLVSPEIGIGQADNASFHGGGKFIRILFSKIVK